MSWAPMTALQLSNWIKKYTIKQDILSSSKMKTGFPIRYDTINRDKTSPSVTTDLRLPMIGMSNIVDHSKKGFTLCDHGYLRLIIRLQLTMVIKCWILSGGSKSTLTWEYFEVLITSVFEPCRATCMSCNARSKYWAS